MSRHTPAQIRALATVSLGVVEAVEAGGEQGAPAGVLYASMQAQGATFTQFTGVMDTLVRPGYLKLEHDCYHSTNTTQELKTKLTNTLAAFAS
jgi:hypothetical protein